uniref:Uncharacterized protein n=1 Tax=Mycena chlorophos TaxID=658473 RepID=A0ABQ0M531_MYCCL|nr:predicted protein [Mycena chlorophos]
MGWPRRERRVATDMVEVKNEQQDARDHINSCSRRSYNPHTRSTLAMARLVRIDDAPHWQSPCLHSSPVPLARDHHSLQSFPVPLQPRELFGPNYSTETHLGSPRVPTQSHPKTRIAQPVLKLAAVKERLEDLESTNERLTVQIDSLKTDIEMLNSSVSYFSSEYYSGLLTIRELRARSKKDAEILSAQEQQLCQLKKFVGLMVELGLHEPVLARAHGDVLKGKEDFEARLVDAIRAAAARPGSAWSQILSEVDPSRPVVPIVAPSQKNFRRGITQRTSSISPGQPQFLYNN